MNFILIAVCILAGFCIRKAGLVGNDAHKGINTWIIYLALPAVSFKYLPHIEWSEKLLVPALTPVIVWLGGWLFVSWYARKNKLPKNTEGAIKLPASLSNTSFVGFPLVAAYFGEQHIGTAVICDQVCFMIMSTAGIVVAVNSAQQQKLTAKLVLTRVLRFPPFVATILALTIPLFVSLEPIAPLFDKIAATVAPLALFSIGLQLSFEGWRTEIKHISYALLYKLIIAPALVLGILLLMRHDEVSAKVSLFEAAMPSLLTSGVVATEYKLHPRLANLIIGVGIVLSFASTAVWYLVIQAVMSK